MAILTVDSLTGCNSIPSFLGGSGDTPANPSIMIFHQTNAPTNWTKVTTWNDTGLRVIGAANGNPITTGGTLPFTQTFANRPAGPGTMTSDSVAWPAIGPATLSITPATGDMSGFPGTTQPATLGVAQLSSHLHTFGRRQSGSILNAGTSTGSPTIAVLNAGIPGPIQTPSGLSAPAPTSHNHGVSAPHTHGFLQTSASHSHGISGEHTHTYTGSADFTINYVDIIIATKN